MRIVRAYRLCCVLAAVGAVVNFLLAAFLFSRARRPVEYHVSVTQPHQPDLSWTNALVRASLPLAPVSESNSVDVVSSSIITNRYVSLDVVDYGTIGPDTDLVAWLNGRFVRRGTLLPWGVVDFVFPERIVLTSGDWLTNRRYSNANFGTNP